MPSVETVLVVFFAALDCVCKKTWAERRDVIIRNAHILSSEQKDKKRAANTGRQKNWALLSKPSAEPWLSKEKTINVPTND